MKKTLHFTVDSRLLQELGDRLVGKPSTALAELIKNSYDADATGVGVTLEREGKGCIRIEDDGHGMTFEEFERFWMRVGSQHKRDQLLSPGLRRPLTGSKGVGRIAAQILSDELRLISVSAKKPNERLLAHLNWREAIETGELVNVVVNIRTEPVVGDSEPGTTLLLEGLRNAWSPTEVRELGQELWRLQPPFGRTAHPEHATAADFHIEFKSPEPALVKGFREETEAVLQLWTARAVGACEESETRISIEFKDGASESFVFPREEPSLGRAAFELRFFDLQGKQPHGIKVGEARGYLGAFGGVHIFDAGFRLPFYGEVDNDWLLISRDTARRVAISKLLPSELQVSRGMLSLPQWYQVLGMVEINTSEEERLEVTITRDRLVESKAFDELRDSVRTAIHWYANIKARRRLTAVAGQAHVIRPSSAIGRALRAVRENKSQLPEALAEVLESTLAEAQTDVRDQESQTADTIRALSTYAAAGIAAMGYQHEVNRQLVILESIARKIRRGAKSGDGPIELPLTDLADQLSDWTVRIRGIGRMFAHLADPQNQAEETRLHAKRLLALVIEQMEPIRREASFDLDLLDPDLRLPLASSTEWISVFQNSFFNALNAMVESNTRLIRVSSTTKGGAVQLVVEDTGAGIDLDEADQLFEPFARGITISRERNDLGFGGMGLGLTIIQMICSGRDVDVAFVEPAEGFSTALRFEWVET